MFQLDKINKNSIFIAIAVLAVLVTGVLIVDRVMPGGVSLPELSLGDSGESAAKKAIEHLNANVLQGQTATLNSYTKESGVIKINLEIGGNNYDSYVTKDGKLFFPEALKIGQAAPAQ
ncbi:MAG: hypothetical protein Q7S10_01720 [bacterium]|nr:hypothetical protein [bacterium]